MANRKKLIIGILICLSGNLLSQDLADSTITQMAAFNCECQDTIEVRQENEPIVNQINECFTKSLVTFLNRGELSQDYLNDNSKLSSLQDLVFNLLSTCEKTIEIVNKLKGVPIPIDSAPQELFISEAFFKKHGMEKIQTEKDFIVWASEESEHLQRIVDIRWVFETNEETLKYHQANLALNSENGQEVKFTNSLEGAEELYVFKESKQIENMLKMMDLPQKQHYFLFVVENVVFKVFVATDKTLEATDVIFIPEEAIRKLREYKN